MTLKWFAANTSATEAYEFTSSIIERKSFNEVYAYGQYWMVFPYEDDLNEFLEKQSDGGEIPSIKYAPRFLIEDLEEEFQKNKYW